MHVCVFVCVFVCVHVCVFVHVYLRDVCVHLLYDYLRMQATQHDDITYFWPKA